MLTVAWFVKGHDGYSSAKNCIVFVSHARRQLKLPYLINNDLKIPKPPLHAQKLSTAIHEKIRSAQYPTYVYFLVPHILCRPQWPNIIPSLPLPTTHNLKTSTSTNPPIPRLSPATAPLHKPNIPTAVPHRKIHTVHKAMPTVRVQHQGLGGLAERAHQV